MSWDYSGDPRHSNLDAVRFLSGDTIESRPLVTNEEIEYCLVEQSNPRLAAALLLRGLAARYSREASMTVGPISVSQYQIAEAFIARARELDPTGITVPVALVVPKFGGNSQNEKDLLDMDADGVQPMFKRGQFDE